MILLTPLLWSSEFCSLIFYCPFQVGVLKMNDWMNSPMLWQIQAESLSEDRAPEDCFCCLLWFTSFIDYSEMIQAFIPRLVMLLRRMPLPIKTDLPVHVVKMLPAVHLPLIVKCWRWENVLTSHVLACLLHQQILKNLLPGLTNDS